MSKGVKSIKPLGFPWETQDPFIFCAYHRDIYPEGNEQLGPKASLAGRNIGQDFDPGQDWRMYHGSTVPGFPAHPHAGFETVTIVTEGLVDHSDSLGSAGRFGDGDVQWMTAGKGVQHAEMFPLLNQDEKNPFELFQIWLNLPKRSKKVPPHYKMLWAEDIPVIHQTDAEGKKTTVTVYAGTYEGNPAPTPNPDSWAADPANQVALWRFQLEPGATATIPALDESVPRKLFYYQGNSVVADGQTVQQQSIITVDSTRDVEIQNGAETSFLLLMQGKPINEPVATYGPFVANDGSELQALFQEYQRTQFGGWPWDNHDVVHGNEHKRFALHADGSREDR